MFKNIKTGSALTLDMIESKHIMGLLNICFQCTTNNIQFVLKLLVGFDQQTTIQTRETFTFFQNKSLYLLFEWLRSQGMIDER